MLPLSVARTSCILLAFCFAGAITGFSQTFISRPVFNGLNGTQPNSPLTQGLNGHFYGTTDGGGPTFTKTNYGPGTIFDLSPDGKLTTLYNFCSQVVGPFCVDGQSPLAGLILGRDGNLYGTTYSGGSNGAGTFFRITPSGTLTTLHNFCASSCAEGGLPDGIIQGADGNFYGITQNGGASGSGTAFKITPGGKISVLHNFDYIKDGIPTASLVQANDGDFYGVSGNGTINNCVNGCGSIFRVTPTGNFQTIYAFCSVKTCPDGYSPEGSLIQGSDGGLYGTTVLGGANGGGTIFKIALTGQLTTLYDFCAVKDSGNNCLDGNFADVGLVQDTQGNLYGSTAQGGPLNGGTNFEFTLDGTLNVLHTYCPQLSCIDGSAPLQLLQATNGNFYGVTSTGGDTRDCPLVADRGCGNVFLLGVGLAPFVQANPAAGKAGLSVNILGNNLSGATEVTFNGTPATFSAVSSTYIKATVPIGATSGTIQVTSPGGTLSSNVPFLILP